MTVPEPSRQGMPPQAQGASAEGVAGEGSVERRFNRHFAAKQISTDMFGMAVGSLVYLSLVPSLVERGRPELVVLAIACAKITLWPFVLSRRAPAFYTRHRDLLLLVHFVWNYGIGAQLARYVRLSDKLQSTSPASFVGGFVLSSTVMWQSVDALMYRMRYRNFLVFKPLVLLSSLGLERGLCQQTCSAMPEQAHHFGELAELLRLLLAPFRPLPQPLAIGAGGSALGGYVLSCFKVQAFLLCLCSWILPAFVLRRLERQMFCQFVADEQQAVRAAAGANEHQSDAAVQAGSLGGADSSSAASSSGGGGSGMGVRRRLRRMWQCWEQQRVQGAHAQALEGQHPGEGPTPQAALEGLQRWPQWGIPLLLAGFCWHSIDTIL